MHFMTESFNSVNSLAAFRTVFIDEAKKLVSCDFLINLVSIYCLFFSPCLSATESGSRSFRVNDATWALFDIFDSRVAIFQRSGSPGTASAAPADSLGWWLRQQRYFNLRDRRNCVFARILPTIKRWTFGGEFPAAAFC